MRILLMALVVACLAAESAGAASFNCAHAVSPAEEAICGNANLGKLDERTSGMYFVILGSGAAQATISEVQASQGKFIAARDACDTDVDCLVDAYTSQMLYLKKIKDNLGL